MEAAGQGGSCYQLSFQQDAFEGREERLVHGEALEPRSCPLFRGSVPAIPSTEHLHGAHRAQPPLPPARKENGKLTGWGSREEQEGTARNLNVKRAGLLWDPGEGGCPEGPAPSCPECSAGACTAPQAAHGRGGAGKGGVVNPPLTWSPTPPPAEGRSAGRRRSAEKPG